ncbi:MAG: arsenate reductase-like glutaredoxin family protein [Gammaproteobacteria bacterium]
MEANDIEPSQKVKASAKLGRDDAAKLARDAKILIVAKGKKITEFDVGKSTTDDAIAAMLGPTGNLRAPTMRAGNTLLVGFNEERFTEVLVG